MNKLVRDHINEKFTEDSDPIKDMGIGIDKYRVFKDCKELTNWVLKYLPHILQTDEIPDDIISDKQFYLKEKYLELVKNYALKYFDVQNKGTFSCRALDVLPVWKTLRDKLEKMGYKPLDESLDIRKQAEQKTTYITDNKNIGLKKKIINITPDSQKKRVKICLVNGSYVKSTEPGLGFKEFVEGGHHYVDSYPGYKNNIPEDEIWIDDVFKSKPEELKAIIQHEFIERNLMKYKKWSYEKAHEYANKREAELRKRSIK